MRKEYNKLVRDRIPEIIHESGRQCGIETLLVEEYIEALKEKLIEEAKEVATAEPQHIVTELADLYEVIDALMTACKIDRMRVLDEQESRRQGRGGFGQRLLLLWAEERDDTDAEA